MALTLAAVETAITELLTGGQSVSLDGMAVTKASLPSLWEARKQLKLEGARTTRPTIRAFNMGGMGYGSTSGTEAEVTLTKLVT
jgi:hypothetical protein